jgi:cytochrome c-type biogenesis protein
MEYQLAELFHKMPYLVSFLGGIITFLSPCVLPLIPAYLSYISGLSYKQLSGEKDISVQERVQIAQASLAFIFGFGVVFVLLGVVVGDTLSSILKSDIVRIIAGTIIIIFGLNMMKVINIALLNLEVRANFGTTETKTGLMKFIAPMVLGFSFALGWTPCVGPILGSILTLSGQGETDAVLMMTLFALGLGVPFFLSAILTSYAVELMKKIKRHFRLIEIISGSLLILIGLAIATNTVGEITAYL